MKNVFSKINLFSLSILICVSTGALAHPTDADPTILIDIGSTLTLQRDINIPPLRNSVYNEKTPDYLVLITKKTVIPMRSYQEDKSENRCEIRVYDDRSQGRDVVLRAGKKFAVTYNYSSQWQSSKQYSTGLLLESENQETSITFSCFKAGSQYLGISIGQLKEILNGVFSLNLADPVELN